MARARGRLMTAVSMATVLLSSVVATGTGAGPAGAALECAVDTLTDAAIVFNPDVSDDGSRIVFEALDDLTGENADGSFEIFLYDTTGPTLTQVSDTPDIQHSAANPAISGDGTRVVYQANADVEGLNEDQNDEIFLYDIAAEATTAVTPGTTSPVINVGADIDGGGDVVVYTRNGGVPTVQRRDLDEPSAELVGAAPSVGGQVSADGTVVAFTHLGTVYGDNTDLQAEVVVHDTVAETYDQVTVTPYGGPLGIGSAPGGIDAAGDRVTFFSDGNPNGLHAGGGTQVYVHDVSADTVDKLTTFGTTFNDPPVISADGGTVAFSSPGNPKGTNADADDELFTVDVDTDELTQVTRTSGSFGADPHNSQPSLTADGSTVVFQLSETDGRHVGRATCAVAVPKCAGVTVTVDLNEAETPTGGNDVILGTPAGETIDGLGGADLICGAGGNDTILGGAGADTLRGGEGADTLNGGTELDRLFGEAGADTLRGGTGNDVLDGGVGADKLFGDAGNDTLRGATELDTINGGAGNDSAFGGAGNDKVTGAAGNDVLRGEVGNDTLDGGVGDDNLQGAAGRDTCHGRVGRDRQTGCEVRTGIP
jgi:Ca2+-binding RTX toxin-like protein